MYYTKVTFSLFVMISDFEGMQVISNKDPKHHDVDASLG
jgi:hypothetical protein